MRRTTEVIERLCNDKFPSKAVETRKNGQGKELSYASQHYVITRLNEVFGPTGWSCSTVYNNLVAEDITQKDGKSRWEVSHEAKVHLAVHAPGAPYVIEGVRYREGTGHGHGFGAKKGDAIESSAKEAETDALKRAARLLGPSFGLALYDPAQEDVGDRAYNNDGELLSVALKDALHGVTGCTSVGQLYDLLNTVLRPLAKQLPAEDKKTLLATYKQHLEALKNA